MHFGDSVLSLSLLWLCLSLPVIAEEWEREPISPIPHVHDQDEAKAALGDRLFHDVRLSADDSVSCASCHQLGRGGTDGLARSLGIGGALGAIKAPTVYNSGFNLAQFWDGRAGSLEEQVAGPLHSPVEMGSNWNQALQKLNRDMEYVQRFSAVYPDGISAENVMDAIAAFERTLLTVDSPFDQWLRGDEEALGAQAQRGYGLFKSYGCVACHQGVNVGGNLYQLMGVMGDYFADRDKPISTADLGRFNVTGEESDRHMFKVPSLRLAAINPPYFHDGSTDNLREAVSVMARYQLGRKIPKEDVQDIVAFLESLVGRHDRLSP